MAHTLTSGVLQRFLPGDLGQSYTAGSHGAITDNAISNTKPSPTWVVDGSLFPSMQEVEFENVTYTTSVGQGGNRLHIIAPVPGAGLNFDYYTLASEYTSETHPSSSQWNTYTNTAAAHSLGDANGLYNPSWGDREHG